MNSDSFSISNLVLYLTTAGIIITKFFDCYSTMKKIKYINQEKNPIAKYFMRRIGIKNTIWGIFVLAVIITIMSLVMVLNAESLFYLVLYLLVGNIISIIQFAVAHTNYTDETNFVTEFLFKLHRN